MIATHQEEISQLMQEFDKHEIDTSVQLDGYEQGRKRQTPELGATTFSQPPTTTHTTDQEEVEEEETDKMDSEEDEVEPSLFDILQDDAKEEDDPRSDQQE